MSRLATASPTNGKPVHPSAVDANTLKRLMPMPKPLDEIAVGDEDIFGHWKQELDRAKAKLDREAREDEWDKILRFQRYEMTANERYNFVAPIIEDLINEVTGERPEITVKVKRESERSIVPQLEALLSWDVDTKHGWDVVQKIARDAGWFGIGWGKQVWQSGLESTFLADAPDMTSAAELEQLAVIDLEHQLLGAFPGQTIGVQPTDIDWLHIERHKQHTANPLTPLEIRLALEHHIEEHRARHFATSSDSRSILTKIDPRNVLYDPDAQEWDRVRWVAERSVEIWEDMKQNPVYNRAAVNKIQPLQDTIDKEEEGDENTADRPVDERPTEGPRWNVADVWRIYDRRNERMIVYCPQQKDKKLLALKDWPYRGMIYRPLVFVPVARQIEGVPLARMLEPGHEDLAFVQKTQREMVRKQPKQQLYINRGAVTEEEQAAIIRGDRDFHFVDRNPRDIVFPVDPPKVNPEIFALRDSTFDYQNRTVRSSEVSQGVSGGAKFATEIEALLAAQGRSLRTLREAVKDWIETLKGVQKDQYHDFASAEIVMQVSGGEGIKFNPLRPEEIPIDCEIIVDVDSFSAISKEVNKRLSRELFQTITAIPEIMAMFTPEGWVKFVGQLLRVHGVRDAESLLAPVAAAQMIHGLQQQAALPAPEQGGAIPAPPIGQGLAPQVPTSGALGGQVAQGI